MNITFLIRHREVPTALRNAAAYDARFINGLGHSATVVSIPEADVFPRLNGNSDLLIVEGAGWMPVEVLAKVQRAGCRVVVRVHAAPAFIHWEFAGTSTSFYITQCKAAGIGVGFVHPMLAEIYPGTDSLGICYPVPSEMPALTRHDDFRQVDVGCFGAIRPLKNQLAQLYAVALAQKTWFKHFDFFFHINSTRVEGDGYILGEIKQAAKDLCIRLVCHDWESKEDFKESLAGNLSIGMCASLAESFCLTAADLVTAGVPTVLSYHIPWAAAGLKTDLDSMSQGVWTALENPYWLHSRNFQALKNYVRTSQFQWGQVLTKAADYEFAH